MLKFFLLAVLFMNFAQAETVRILAWNVFMLPKPIHFSLQKERTPLIIEEINKSEDDIIVLQEAFSGDFRAKLRKRTKDKYPHQYYLNRKRFSFTVYGSGVYFLSKYPLKDLGYSYYKDCTKADCFASKGVAVMEVSLPSGKKIHLGGTHLQAGGKEKSQRIRVKQLSQIKKLFESTRNENIPQILVGDLNIDALLGAEFAGALALLDMSSGALEGEPGYSNGYTIGCYSKPGDDNKQWLDHVLINPNRSQGHVISRKIRPYYGVIKGQNCPLSDHWAIEALISL